MENLKILDLPIVINKMMVNKTINKLRTELKQLSEKSQHPTELNNYNEKRNFSNLILQNSGIYIIINDRINKFYVGKSENITRRLEDHRNRLFEDSHRNPGLQNDFSELKELLKVASVNWQKIYDTFKIEILVTESFKFQLNEKDKVYFDTVLQNLEDEIRDWFRVNNYTNTYNINLTARQKQKLVDDKKRQLEEKKHIITEKQQQKLEEKQKKKAVRFNIVKAFFPNAPTNAVPVIDIETKQLYVNAGAAAENVVPKPVHSSTITAKIKNPLNKRYRHASISEIEKKRYLPFYDYFFDDAFEKALDQEDIIVDKYGDYRLNRKKQEQERKNSLNKRIGTIGIPQQAIDAAVESNSLSMVDAKTQKYYSNVIGIVKESDQLRSKAQNVKRIHRTTIHRQVSDPLNKRFRYASTEEIKQKRYLPFYDFLFEEVLQAAIDARVVVMGKKGKYKRSFRKHTAFFSELRKNAKKMQKKIK